MTRISSRFTSFLRHNDVTRDEIRVIASYMLSQKTTILILCSFVFSPKLIHSLRRSFHCRGYFSVTKNACTILNTAFKIFRVVAKNKCRHTSKISQQYLYNIKNIKKVFLQLHNNYSMSPSWI